MNDFNHLKDFISKYSLSKTLRFELIPQGKTLDNIQKKGLISKDEERAESYKQMKKTIDGFHKHFIELAMQNVQLSKLNEFKELYFATPERKKEDKYKDDLKKVQTDLRKEIAKGFETGEAKEIFAKIDKKELITELLESWIPQQPEDIYFDEGFKSFTTYFGGFHENRKNMYSDKEQSTAIAYRLIHENLPKFMDNSKTFEILKTKPELQEKLPVLYKEIEEYLNINTIDEAFELDYYNNVLTQKQIDVYNLIIGGRVAEEGKSKIKGLNEYINTEYNQKQSDKKNRIPKLKPLYKQILSDRESTSFIAEAFKKSQEVLDAINEFYYFNLISFQPKDKENTENVLVEIEKLLAAIKEYDLQKNYLRNDLQLTNISQSLFGTYSVFGDALDFYYENVEYPAFKKEYQKESKRKNLDKAKEKFTKQSYISIALLQAALDAYVPILDETHTIRKAYTPTCIADYFHTHFKAKKKEETEKEFSLIANIEAKYSCIKGVLENYPPNQELYQDQNTIDNIKLFLDSLMEFLHFVKPLILPSDSPLEKDNNFYGQLEPWFEQLDKLIPLYNKVRNYATQKPYRTEKIKLNFENKGQFLGGWVDSHTENSDNATQAGGYLFRKKNSINEYDYFVGFSADSKLFRPHLQNEVKENNKSDFERLDYYQLKSASVYGNSYTGESYEKDRNNLFNAMYDFAIGNEKLVADFDKYIEQQKGDSKPTPSGLFKIIQEKYSDLLPEILVDTDFKRTNATITENLKNTILNLHRIAKSKTYAEVDFSLFTEPMEVIEELSREKVFAYFPVSESDFKEVCNRNDKPLFLFKISNKDLSFAETYSLEKRKIEKRGKDNLHTLYFKALMQGNQNVFDIGTGEVFFRKKSLKYTDSEILKGHHYEELKDKFHYPIISNKRFAYDKFQFHLSIVQNYQQPKNPPKDFNEKVLVYLKNNPDVKIIGIDRGERHLIYVSLIDQKGNILYQESLNSITNEKHKIVTPYHTLLANKEKGRADARKNWGTIENIKELKEGYLSQVVHEIAKMMVQHNAIVVMEDLNFGFKRGRFKVEKQVYQKLEKMLIDKLNYLVFKDKKPNEIGGLYNALQLTNKFTSFKEMGKQIGFLFYVPAWNTSKIDPTTGFVNLFDTRYESVGKAQIFFNKFESISYNAEKNYFVFGVQEYTLFNPKAAGTRQDWFICTFGDRILTFRNPEKNNLWDNKIVGLTGEFKTLFHNFKIDFQHDLKNQIAAQNDKVFFEKLLHLLKLTLQMRNSITNSEVDYLISPVINGKGEFFDSRKADISLPKDADANGAYHIAQKGLWALQQINVSEDLKKIELAISNKDWLRFVQGRQ